jgi:CHAD domain-containing protein
MAYRYELGEAFDVATRRILLEQLDRAEHQLKRNDDAVTAVHEARKSFKRVRALLRLLRDGIPAATYQKANAQVRDLGRLLAQSRDLDVMPQTLDHLCASYASASPAFVERVRAAIERARKQAALDAREPPVRQAVKEIGKVRKLFDKMSYDACDLALLRTGLARELRGFVRKFDDALAVRDAEAFHEWRKRAQFHRRHLALFSMAWPQELEFRIAASRDLSSDLGLDHDLAVLAEFISGPDSKPATKRDAQRLLELCQAEQAELRRRACTLGALLAAEEPKAFARRLEAYWKVRCRQPDDLRIAAK